MDNELHAVLALAGLPSALAMDVSITGCDPIVRTPFRIGEAGAVAIAVSALAAVHLWTIRTGIRQQVRLDVRAAAAAMRSSRYLKVDGETPRTPTDDITGIYKARGGQFVYLHCNFPNLRERNLAVLGADSTRPAVAKAVAGWEGAALEDAIVEAGGCGSLVRTEAAWNALDAARAVAAVPVLEIKRIGEAPPEPFRGVGRPLAGMRVLDLTRVLAGPTCARTLAEHGAEVLRISRKGLTTSGAFDMDTAHGKRSAWLDLRKPAEHAALAALTGTADVFLQAYRPGTLAGRGFGAEALAQLRPGIVHIDLSAWGHRGPWAMRRGFDTVVQSAAGMATAFDIEKPELQPVSVLDYVAGYLAACGAMAALARRAVEGGSWHVQVSLASAAHWVRSFGLVPTDEAAAAPADLSADVLEELLMETETPFGLLTHLAPAARLSVTRGRWATPATPLGYNLPHWTLNGE